MSQPLVTVICVCFNHASFVEEALESVIAQTYPNVELIVIDDGSTDGSVKVIKRWAAKYPQTTILLNGINQGYCKTFNKAYQLSKGEFVIDLAADDVLKPNRIEAGIALFEKRGPSCGVTFSDAEYIDATGKTLYFHSDKFPHQSVPQGDVYKSLIERYFICSPTMMFRSAVLQALQGYDETLAYEDFDLWIRASRNFHFCYIPEPLVKKRNLTNSLSMKQFRRGSMQRESTLAVCKKIKELNRTKAEDAALRKRIIYETVLSLRIGDYKLAFEFGKQLFR